MWYIVEYKQDDDSFGEGFEDLEDAKRALNKQYMMGHEDVKISVIKNGECIQELRIEDI